MANKEALLDALADWIYGRIELPLAGEGWREGMTRRASSARAVLAAHPWALGLIESRTSPGPALLAHHDAVLGCLAVGAWRRNLLLGLLAAMALVALARAAGLTG